MAKEIYYDLEIYVNVDDMNEINIISTRDSCPFACYLSESEAIALAEAILKHYKGE